MIDNIVSLLGDRADYLLNTSQTIPAKLCICLARLGGSILHQAIAISAS